jgi:gliding motility-associated-like protein
MVIFRGLFLFVLLCSLLVVTTQAQQTAKMTTGGRGYLEKLPPDYATNTTKKYPVLFFLHGTGETGTGSPADLNKVKAHGPPYHINNGHNMCFMVNGVEECFIVISPQLNAGAGGWWPSILNDFINHVLTGPNNYRIDLNRIYLTGLSLGGWGVYIGVGDPGIADIFAAAAPVSGFGNGNGCSIAARQIPVWGFHGTNDGTITYANGLTEFNRTGLCTTPVTTAEQKWTPYTGLGHNIWNNYAYRTDNNLHTPNLYQWLLSKSKNNSAPTLVVTNPAAVCAPATVDLTALAVTAGSTAGLTYSYWLDAAATSPLTTPTAATNGTYYIKGTNAGGSSTRPVVVTVSALPSLVVTNPAPVCGTGTANLTAAAITSGSSSGLTFTYWTDAAATFSLSNPSTAIAGTYYIRGRNAAGCDRVLPVVISSNALPTLVINNPAVTCPPSVINITDPSITAGSSSGLTLSYWTNSTATVVLSNPSSVASGTYYIRATNAFGCADIKPIIVTVNGIPTLNVTAPAAVCAPATINITDPAITVGSSGGLTFSYWADAATTVPLSNPSSIATSGTYFIKGTNGATCATTRSITVIVNPLPTVVITNPPGICAPATANITAASITTGSTAGVTFSYWTDAGASSSLSNPSTVGAGTYFIRGTTAAGCSSTQSVTVTANPLPTLLITNPATACPPSSIDITPPAITLGSTPGLTLTYWLNAAATTPMANPTAALNGTFYIKGTNTFGCADVKPVVVTISGVPGLVVNNPSAVCAPNTVDITTPAITAGSGSGSVFSYWMDAGASTPVANPTVATNGTYYIQATNVAGCTNIKAVVVTVNSIPNLVLSNQTVCSPSNADLTSPSVTAGSSSSLNFTYWTNSTATSVLANPSAVTVSGTYYIKATNLALCSSVAPVVVTINTKPTVVITNPATACAPATVDLSDASIVAGSSSGLTFSYWTDLTTSNPMTSVTTAPNGTYFIKGLDSQGCSDVKPVVVTISQIPTLDITNPNAACGVATTFDLTLPAIINTSSPGLTLTYWNDGAGTSPVATPSSVSSGVYYIKGTNAGGCSIINPVTATAVPIPLLNTPASASICSGATTNIALNTSNAVPGGVSYSWTSSLTAGSISGNASGTGTSISQTLVNSINTTGRVEYTIVPSSIVGNCVGASGSTSINILPIPTASVNATSTSMVCNGCSTNIILLNPNNVAGTTFSWTASPLVGTVTGHAPGTGASITQTLSKSTTNATLRYSITPQASGCSGTPLVFDVRVNSSPTANAGGNFTIVLPTNTATLNGSGSDADGSISTYSWTKISGPATFNISGDATPTATLTNLLAGVYGFRLTVADNDGAIGVSNMLLTVSPKPNTAPLVSAGNDVELILPANSLKLTGIASDSDGSIVSSQWLQVSGPKASMNVSGTELNLVDLLQGSYTFRFSATDNNNQTENDDVNVNVIPDPKLPPAKRLKFITPNDDGSNDLWVLDPDVLRYADCKLTILSNAGEKVFEAFGYLNNWDGTHSGKPLPQDVYYYVCDCKSSKETGSITIIR